VQRNLTASGFGGCSGQIPVHPSEELSRRRAGVRQKAYEKSTLAAFVRHSLDYGAPEPPPPAIINTWPLRSLVPSRGGAERNPGYAVLICERL
jgi:hypothetical protein